jgi:hypothetical protein
MKKLWCLFIALALTVAFTFAQSATSSSAFGDELPWLKIYTTKNPGDKSTEPSNTVIYSTAAPEVTRVAPQLWKIVFHKTIDYR